MTLLQLRSVAPYFIFDHSAVDLYPVCTTLPRSVAAHVVITHSPSWAMKAGQATLCGVFVSASPAKTVVRFTQKLLTCNLQTCEGSGKGVCMRHRASAVNRLRSNRNHG